VDTQKFIKILDKKYNRAWCQVVEGFECYLVNSEAPLMILTKGLFLARFILQQRAEWMKVSRACMQEICKNSAELQKAPGEDSDSVVSREMVGQDRKRGTSHSLMTGY
jgi:hypothetical protein